MTPFKYDTSVNDLKKGLEFLPETYEDDFLLKSNTRTIKYIIHRS